MKLSIIICVYNTDRAYFKSCLESIRRSTLDDYEICVVDDGSTVDYSDFVTEYGLKYKKTENRGILAARLTGISMAEGEYSAFCDSDDTVSFNYHRPMTEKADRDGCDVVINDWAFHTERARYYCKADSTVSRDFELEGEDVLMRFLSQEGREHSYFVLWNKIYRTSLLRAAAESVSRGEIALAPSAYAEDALINFFAFKQARKLSNVHTGYYFYRIHSSQSVNVVSEAKLLAQIGLMGKTLDEMRRNLPDSDRRHRMEEHIRRWGELMSRTHYSYAVSAGYTAAYEIIKKAYRVEKLAKSTMRDQSAYVNNCLLGSNFEQVDAALREVYFDEGVREVRCDRRDQYVLRTLSYLASKGRTVRISDTAEVSIPKQRTSLKNRLLHNYYVYTLGMILFKKGSRLRAFLKKRI